MRSTLYLNAAGKRVSTKFTIEEIKEVFDLVNSVFKHDFGVKLTPHETSQIINTKANRIERFIYFLQSTRNQSHLASRIGMYCTLLETLLSTEKDEISHKIAERTARLLGNTYEEREEIFKFVKDAYAIRSANVHGDKMPKKFRSLEKQEEISVQFDNYLRQLYKMIITNDEIIKIYEEDNTEKLREWFNKLILS